MDECSLFIPTRHAGKTIQDADLFLKYKCYQSCCLITVSLIAIIVPLTNQIYQLIPKFIFVLIHRTRIGFESKEMQQHILGEIFFKEKNLQLQYLFEIGQEVDIP